MLHAVLTSEASCDFRCGSQSGRRDRGPTFLAATVFPTPEPLERLCQRVRLLDAPTRRCVRPLGMFLKGAEELLEHHFPFHAADGTTLRAPARRSPSLPTPLLCVPHSRVLLPIVNPDVNSPPEHRLLDVGPIIPVTSGKAWACGDHG